MKSVHLTNCWHDRSGGIATFYRALLDEAERQGRSVALIVPGEQDGCEERGHTRIYTVRGGRSPFDRNYRLIAPNRWPGINRRVAEILRQEQPDLIEISDKFSLHYVAGLIRRGLFSLPHRPVLVGLSCERFDDTLGAYVRPAAKQWRLSRWYMKWIYFGFFDHHIAVSAHTAAELEGASRGHVRERGVWIRPMGVDLGSFCGGQRREDERLAMARRAGGDERSRLVLYAGRLAPEKNLPLLVEAFERLVRGAGPQDYRLIVAGEGRVRRELEEDCQRRFPGRALFVGHVASRPELAQLYANCDVFVHANPSEPFGIAPLEAMASGLAVVVPDRGGVLEYAHAGNAWLAPPEPVAFARAIVEALEGDDREARLIAAQQTAAQLAWPAVAGRFLDLYAEFIREGTAAAPHFRSTPGTWLGGEIRASQR